MSRRIESLSTRHCLPPTPAYLLATSSRPDPPSYTVLACIESGVSGWNYPMTSSAVTRPLARRTAYGPSGASCVCDPLTFSQPIRLLTADCQCHPSWESCQRTQNTLASFAPSSTPKRAFQKALSSLTRLNLHENGGESFKVGLSILIVGQGLSRHSCSILLEEEKRDHVQPSDCQRGHRRRSHKYPPASYTRPDIPPACRNHPSAFAHSGLGTCGATPAHRACDLQIHCRPDGQAEVAHSRRPPTLRGRKIHRPGCGR